MKTILISGANGFLGSYLCNYFCKKNNYTVIGLIRSSSETHRIEQLKSSIHLYEIDKVDIDFIFNKYKINIIINTVCNYGRKNSNYEELFNSNFLFGKNLIDIAISFNVDLFINTDTLLPENLNSYSETKTLFRKYIRSLNSKLKIVNLRIDHMYGPGDDTNKFIPWLINQIRNTTNEIELTSGDQLRDFIYIDDVVSAFYNVVLASSKLNSYIEYDLITDQSVKMKKIILLISEKISSVDNKSNLSRLNFGAKEYRKNEVMTTTYTGNSLNSIAWKPRFSLDYGISKILNKK